MWRQSRSITAMLMLVGLAFAVFLLATPFSNARADDGVGSTVLSPEDVRAYRIRQMAATDLEPLFPVWGIPTETLAREMIASGMKAILTCIDTRNLDRAFAGRQFDDHLLAVLPDGVDPCGENGEFHSFVYAGPMFRSEIVCSVGEQVTQEPFIFTDLVVGEASRSSS